MPTKPVIKAHLFVIQVKSKGNKVFFRRNLLTEMKKKQLLATVFLRFQKYKVSTCQALT